MLELAPFRWYESVNDGSNSGPYKQVDMERIKGIKVSLPVG